MEEAIIKTELEAKEEEKGEPIMRGDFSEATKQLKNDKASGVDAFRVELIKNGGEILTGRLYNQQHLHAWNNSGIL